MKCEKCGKPAVSQVTSVVNGKKEEHHYCSECFARVTPFGNVTRGFDLPIIIEEFGQDYDDYGDDGLNENGVPYEYSCGDEDGCECGSVPAFLENFVMSFAGDLFGKVPRSRLIRGDVSQSSENQSEKKSNVFCSGCGLTHEEISKTQKAGCAKCYHVFDTLLMKKYRRFSDGRSYSGKDYSPKLIWNDIDHLQSELNTAVKAQDFELAAQIRDGIKKLQKKASVE